MLWVSDRTLDAAGITDPRLRAAYETCRKLNADHGKTYYLASLLLPPATRPNALLTWGANFLAALPGGPAPDDDPAIAMIHTMRRWNIPRQHVEAFLESM